MGADVASVETPGETFQGSMRHLWVNWTLGPQYFNCSKILDSGKFATGTLVRHYTSGAWVPVIIDITTNHGGYFAFKVT